MLTWFSARVRVVCLVESGEPHDYADSLFIFRAADWDAAKSRAITLGRRIEEEYLNADGCRVRWVLKEILTLDMIQATDIDGAEVYHGRVPLEEDVSYPFDAVFAPEVSQPDQTL